jgi:antitoxin VapB
MKTAKLFRNGDSQAVRLPKEFRFTGREVLIQKLGDAVVLLPKARAWATLVGSLELFPIDFPADRDQPARNERRSRLG